MPRNNVNQQTREYLDRVFQERPVTVTNLATYDWLVADTFTIPINQRYDNRPWWYGYTTYQLIDDEIKPKKKSTKKDHLPAWW